MGRGSPTRNTCHCALFGQNHVQMTFTFIVYDVTTRQADTVYTVQCTRLGVHASIERINIHVAAIISWNLEVIYMTSDQFCLAKLNWLVMESLLLP